MPGAGCLPPLANLNNQEQPSNKPYLTSPLSNNAGLNPLPSPGPAVAAHYRSTRAYASDNGDYVLQVPAHRPELRRVTKQVTQSHHMPVANDMLELDLLQVCLECALSSRDALDVLLYNVSVFEWMIE